MDLEGIASELFTRPSLEWQQMFKNHVSGQMLMEREAHIIEGNGSVQERTG